METESTSSVLQRVSSIAEEAAESRLEAVFNFLFNISDQDHLLQHADCFDEEERQLLLNHRCLFHEKQPSKRHRPSDQSHLFGHFQLFGHSLDDIINVSSVPVSRCNDSLEVGLVSKLEAAKKRELDIRSSVLELLGAVELHPHKKEAGDMLVRICEVFEYSECERQLMHGTGILKVFGLY